MITRQTLIGQLQHALSLLESGDNRIVEFDIDTTKFCFEFNDLDTGVFLGDDPLGGESSGC